MDEFEAFAATVVAKSGYNPSLVVPGFTVAAQTIDGSWQYSNAFGKESTDADARAVTNDSTFWIASMTKIVTTIAAMQCVERGLLSLDEDITRVFTEWKDPIYFDGFDDAGKPVLKPTNEKMTLRALLTHMTGMATKHYHPLRSYYESMEPTPDEWELPNEEPLSLILVKEPNKVFHYGAALDWTGRMVERVTGLSLRDYFKQHIFSPLGVETIDFHIKEGKHLEAKLCQLSDRDAGGNFTISSLNQFSKFHTKNGSGGGGLYGDAASFTRVLAALLGGKLLKKETVSEMLTPQLKDADFFHRTVVEDAQSDMFRVGVLGSIPREIKLNFGLGGLVTLEDIKGARRSGSISWSGLPNCYWWADMTTGVCGCYCSQLLPPGDAPSADLFARFEKAVYSQLAKS